MKKIRLPSIPPGVSRFFNRVKHLIFVPVPIGGLSISDTALKFLLIRGTTIIQASLRIPPGIIEHGRIKNAQQFSTALQNLHQQIAPLEDPIPVILTIPSSLVYSQPFAVPIVDEKNMLESIDLNLQMISPHSTEKSYYDWQEITASVANPNQIELLGAFAQSDIIESYSKILQFANFNLVAAEFPGLSLTRLIQQKWSGFDLKNNYLLMYLNGEGILLLILKESNLFFHHFTSWEEILKDHKDRKMSFENIKEVLESEIRRVLNYYLGKFGSPLNEVILISPIFQKEITDLITKDFSVKVRTVTIVQLPKLQPNWFSVLGTALRGLIDRPEDTNITLTKDLVQKGYYQERIYRFITLWRNLILTVLIFVIISFTIVDTVFLNEDRRLSTKLASEFSGANLGQDALLQKRISEFNSLLAGIEKIADKQTFWSPFLSGIKSLAGPRITLARVIASQGNGSVVITGGARNEEEALAFKNRLLADPLILSVNLPLSNIKPQSDGSVVFNLSFTASSLKF